MSGVSGGSRFDNVGPEVVLATSLVEVGSAGGSRYPDSLSSFAGRHRTPSYHDVHSMETAIPNEGWPLIYTILTGSVGVAETA